MKATAENKPILFLGDSLTELYDTNTFFPNQNILNYGLSGDTTFDVLMRLKECLALSPSTLFLQIGVNDLIFFRGKRAEPEEVARRVISIAEAFSNCKKNVVSLYPVNGKKILTTPSVIRNCNNEKIAATNEAIKRLCERKNFEFIDVYPLLLDSRGVLDDNLSVEGLHLTERGYETVTRKLKEYLPTDKP